MKKTYSTQSLLIPVERNDYSVMLTGMQTICFWILAWQWLVLTRDTNALDQVAVLDVRPADRK